MVLSLLFFITSVLCGSVFCEEESTKEPIPLIQIPPYVYRANNLYKKLYSVVDSEVCDVPYVAILNIKEKKGTKECSGAILDSTHILTVAQCVEEALEISVAVGFKGKSNIKDTFPAKSWVKHPKYRSKPKIKHDIAVVTLNRPIRFSKCIKPISLPTAKYARTTNICMVSGWGRVKGNRYLDTLYKAYVKVTPSKTCEELVDHDQLSQFSCMKESRNAKVGACLSDLGRPLTCNEAVGDQTILEGLTSLGFCKKNISLFVNVSFYRLWIKQQLD